MANQEPLSAKIPTARKNDVTGVTERRDFNRSHFKPKQGLSLRRRGFMAVGEAVASDLSDSRLCNGAVHGADADRRRQNGDDASYDQPSGAIVITPSTPDRSGERRPSRACYRGACRTT